MKDDRRRSKKKVSWGGILVLIWPGYPCIKPVPSEAPHVPYRPQQPGLTVHHEQAKGTDMETPRTVSHP